MEHTTTGRKIIAHITLGALMVTQLATGVFPIPIAPISRVSAAIERQGCQHPTVPLKQIQQGLSSVTFFEKTRNNPGPANNVVTYGANSSQMDSDISQSRSNNELATTAEEYYDFYFSDRNGNRDPNGSYITIDMWRQVGVFSNGGHNITQVRLNLQNGNTANADIVTRVITGENGFESSHTAILGNNDQNTTLGNGSNVSITVGFCGVTEVIDDDDDDNGNQCREARMAYIDLQPNPPLIPGEFIDLEREGYNITFFNRDSLSTITSSVMDADRFDVVFFHNGCGGATGLLSSSELNAIRNYYLDGGHLSLTADDNHGDTANGQQRLGNCTARINQISSNLGVTFSGLIDNSSASLCQSVTSNHPIFDGEKRIARFSDAQMTFTGNVSWGSTSPQTIATHDRTAKAAIAYIPEENGHGSVLFNTNEVGLQYCGPRKTENYLDVLGLNKTCDNDDPGDPSEICSVNFDRRLNGDTVDGTRQNGHVFPGTFIDNEFADAGFIFSSNGRDTIATGGLFSEASSPPNFLVGFSPNGTTDSFFPITADIVNPFTQRVSTADRVDVTLISVGEAGVEAIAYDINGNEVDSETVFGSNDGRFEKDRISLRGNGITRVEFERINQSNTIDGFGIDDIEMRAPFCDDNPPECSDGEDNDDDGFIDFPDDPGCDDGDDDDEFDDVDLKVRKKADASKVSPGENITYDIEVENRGDSTAIDTVVTDTIPSGLRYLRNLSDSRCFELSNDTVECGPIDIDGGEKEEFELVFEVLDIAECNSELINTATVRADNTSSTDSDKEEVDVECPDNTYTLDKTDNKDTASPGEILTYEITVQNNGPRDVTDLEVRDDLPNNVTFLSASDGGQQSRGDVVWRIDLDDGESKTLELRVEVDNDANDGERIENEVCVERECAEDRTVVTEDPGQCTAEDINRISLQQDYALLKVRHIPYFNPTIHIENTPWVAAPGPWGNSTITDLDLTQAPFSPKQRPTTPKAIVLANDNLYLHSNLQDIPNTSWTNITANAPWGNKSPADVGITQTRNESSGTIAAVTSVGSDVYLYTNESTYAGPKNTWVNVGDNPWGNAAIKDIDVTFRHKAATGPTTPTIYIHVIAGGKSYFGTAPFKSTTTINFEEYAARFSNGERLDSVFNPVITKRGSDAFYSGGPWSRSTLPWSNINDNNPWGSTFIDDIAVHFFSAYEPWDTDSLAMLVSDGVPYLHWSPANINRKPDAKSTYDWLDVSYNAPWNQPGNTICNPLDPTFRIEKTDNQTTAEPGNTLTYEIEVRNTSSVDASNILIVDDLPNNVTFVSASDGGQRFGGDVEWTIDLDAGETKTLELRVEVDNDANDGERIENEVCIERTSDCADDTTTVTDEDEADLEVQKTGPAQILRGTTIVYNINVKNNGPDDAEDVSVIDVIPEIRIDGQNNFTDLVFNSSESDSRCFRSGENVVCDGFDLNDGRDRDLKIAFDVPSIAECNSTIVNSVRVFSTVSDPTSGNNNDTYTSTVSCENQTFTIDKTDNQTIVSPDEVLTYEITVRNTSSVDAQDVRIVDDLPNNVTFVSASDGGQRLGGDVEWTIDLDAGQTKVLELRVRVDSNANDQDTIFNEACVDGTFVCDSDTNTVKVETFVCSDTQDNDNDGKVDFGPVVCIDPSPGADPNDPRFGCFTTGDLGCDSPEDDDEEDDFTLTKTDGKTFVAPNETITYTISVTNNHAISKSFRMIDTLPNQVSFVDASNNGFHDNGTVTWKLSLNPGQTATRTVTVTVNSNTSNGTTLLNTVRVGSVTATDTTTVQVNGNTQFSIDKTDNRTTARRDDTLTYRITVQNTGNQDATNVDVRDDLPNNVSFLSASDSGQQSGGDVLWTIDLDAGQSKTLELRVRVDSNARDGDTVFNEACIDGSTCATDTTRIEVDDDTEFTIDKTDNRSTAERDDTLSYRITVRNTSNTDARDVEVTDTIPSDTSFLSADRDGSRSGDTVRWRFDLPANSSITLTLNVRVRNGVRDGDRIRNTACVENGPCADDSTTIRVQDDDDDNIVIDDDDDFIPPIIDDDDDFIPPIIDDDDGFTNPPNLDITKTADRTEALAGSIVSYTITIRNTGGTPIINAVLTDDFPEQYVTVSDPGGGSDAGGTLRWNLGTLGASSTTVIRYRTRLKLNLPRGTRIHNTATVRSGTITRSDSHTVIVPVPPQTGLGGFIKSFASKDDNLTNSAKDTGNLVAVAPKKRLGETMIDAVPVSSSASTNLPIIVWMTTMLTGISAGGMFGKKFLF